MNRLRAKLVLGAAGASLAWTAAAELSVRVNVPSYTLTVFDAGRAVTSFPVRVGCPGDPTPIGRGFITRRRERVVMRYLEGEKQGEIIERSYLVPTGRTIDMPYSRMRGLDMKIGNDDGKVIHSTTEYWTIGFPDSHGCVGLNIDDMLVLFDLIRHVPVAITTAYDTVERRGDTLLFHADIYQRESNTLAKVLALGVPVSDTASAQNRIDLITQTLRRSLRAVLKRLEAGQDPRRLLGTLTYSVPVGEFLLPYYPRVRVVTVSLREGDGFVDAFVREGLTAGTASRIAAAVPEVDYRRLQVGDSFTLFIREEEIVRMEFNGRQGQKRFTLEGKNLLVMAQR